MIIRILSSVTCSHLLVEIENVHVRPPKEIVGDPVSVLNAQGSGLIVDAIENQIQSVLQELIVSKLAIYNLINNWLIFREFSPTRSLAPNPRQHVHGAEQPPNKDEELLLGHLEKTFGTALHEVDTEDVIRKVNHLFKICAIVIPIVPGQVPHPV